MAVFDYYTALDRVSVLLNLHGEAVTECLEFRTLKTDQKARKLWDEAQEKLAELYQHLGHLWAEADDLTYRLPDSEV